MARLTKEEKRQKKQYWKDIKDTQKRLKKQAAEWRPWDWSYATDMFITSIEGFEKYYRVDYNVVAEDDKDIPRG